MIKVIILTPMALEYEAVAKQLNGTPQVVYKEGAAYELATFKGSHHEFQVILREPGMKNLDMALATERAVQHFQPQIALLVGVAGGVKDVRTGDVLIARKVYGYEGGREDEDGYKNRPAVEAISGELLARAQVMGRRNEWKKRTTDGAPEAMVVLGPIAAGDKVIASTNNPTYQRLKTHYNDTLGLETEAIGFATAIQPHRDIHALVVRGISDMCEGKSEEDDLNWQPIAAERAAAFAFEMLWQLDVSQIKTFGSMDIKELARQVVEMVAQQDKSTVASGPIQSIVQAIQPLIGGELAALRKYPQDDDAKVDARSELRRALEGKEGLLRELEQLVKRANDENRGGKVVIKDSKNVIHGSRIEVSGDFHLGDK